MGIYYNMITIKILHKSTIIRSIHPALQGHSNIGETVMPNVLIHTIIRSKDKVDSACLNVNSFRWLIKRVEFVDV